MSDQYDPLQDYQDYLNDGTPYGDKAADEADDDEPRDDDDE